MLDPVTKNSSTGSVSTTVVVVSSDVEPPEADGGGRRVGHRRRRRRGGGRVVELRRGCPRAGSARSRSLPGRRTAATEDRAGRRQGDDSTAPSEPRSSRVHRLDLHDEPRTAAGTVLDPGLAAEGVGVLGDQRQAESGTDPMAGGAAPGEALEDACSLAVSDARSGVLDGDQQLPGRAGGFEADASRPAGVVVGVEQQVAEDPLVAHLVGRDARSSPGRRRRSAHRRTRAEWRCGR